MRITISTETEDTERARRKVGVDHHRPGCWLLGTMLLLFAVVLCWPLCGLQEGEGLTPSLAARTI